VAIDRETVETGLRQRCFGVLVVKTRRSEASAPRVTPKHKMPMETGIPTGLRRSLCRLLVLLVVVNLGKFRIDDIILCPTRTIGLSAAILCLLVHRFAELH
jgi:hypothetical protein